MKIKRITTLALTLFLILVLFACQSSQEPVVSSPFSIDGGVSATETPPPVTPSSVPSIAPLPSVSLQAVFFDVGQGDCALIQTGSHAMLVDAGNVGQDDLILSLLSKYGVNKLDYLVATHPHADHIGSMPAVIRGIDSIDKLLMPDAINTTTIFENLLDAIEEKAIPVTVPTPGDKLALGEAVVTALAPVGTGYADLNNNSIVLHVAFGNVSFLLTGDAEEFSETEQLAADWMMTADVLKVGHHGSHTSTSDAYLSAISPRYAVISCGQDNQYGHPHKDVIDRLIGKGVAIYRTDESGTVTVITDGRAITIETERTPTAKDTAASPSEGGESYIGNKNSKIYHIPTCGSLPAEINRVYFDSEDDAVAQGFRPCKKCLQNKQ